LANGAVETTIAPTATRPLARLIRSFIRPILRAS
jgi:hypothetical protein